MEIFQKKKQEILFINLPLNYLKMDTLVNGYGKGVGEFILNGVADYCLKQKDSQNWRYFNFSTFFSKHII